MSVATVHPDMRLGFLHSFFMLVLVLLLSGLAASAVAQPYGRGFVPPPDWEEILAERLVILPTDAKDLPTTWDWRSQDGVTSVKNQGGCGSCWAFAAAAELESKVKINYNRILNISEQQILSCNPYGSGCGGGWAGSAYYVLKWDGAVLEHCIPYQGNDSLPCTQDDYLKFTGPETVLNWSSVSNNITQIKTAIYNNGPVCGFADANSAWDDYTDGVITGPNTGTGPHLILIVGWDDRLGDNGAWIVKNSWGETWGMGGYCYVAYGACGIGSSVTQIDYLPPPVQVSVYTPPAGTVLYSDDIYALQWATFNETVDAVDIYYGVDGPCHEGIVALGVPNTGSYDWLVPNLATQNATLLVFPSEGTHRGFSFNAGQFTIVGRQTRYVSLAGSNTAPYDTPATAAHSIADAIMAGSGRDSVLIAGDDYYLTNSIAVTTPCYIMGGWNADFTVCDADVYPTRLSGYQGTFRFNVGAGTECGVSNIIFHDSVGSVISNPVAGRHGAAIAGLGASPLIENCRFEDNRAAPGTQVGWGGAVMIHTGSPVIRNCEFVGNVASRGAAVAFSDCVDALLEECLFVANATSDSTASNRGGAIYVYGGTATIRDSEMRGGGAGLGGGLAVDAGAVVVVRDVLIQNNRAGEGGGGVHGAGSVLDMARVDMIENSTWSGNGGGFHAQGGDLSLTNLLVRGNQAPQYAGGLYVDGDAVGHVGNSVFHGNSCPVVGGVVLMLDTEFSFYNNVLTSNPGGGLGWTGDQIDSDWNVAFGNSGGDFMSPAGPHDLVRDPLYADADGGDFSPGMHSPLIDSGGAAGGSDWDGSAIDRGMHGGPLAEARGPAAVGDLQGTFAGGEVSLTWSSVSGAASYAVYRAESADFIASPELAVGIVSAPLCAYQETPPSGDWYYVVGAVDADGRAGGFSARYDADPESSAPEGSLPQALAITGVAPNPFNPRTTVHFDLPRDGHATVQVYDMRGRLVSTLHAGELSAGRHAVHWDGEDRSGRRAATGVYFVRLQDGRESRTTKAVLAK